MSSLVYVLIYASKAFDIVLNILSESNQCLLLRRLYLCFRNSRLDRMTPYLMCNVGVLCPMISTMCIDKLWY